MSLDLIRNFCIIAHIDHGKSTLADRLLELTGTIAPGQMHAQALDTMELEQERGITIKLQPVRMHWQGHELNLIDTPGHVDFTYEVSRSLAACEGALLVVDATQGIQAQTLTNVYMAIAAGLVVIPVINKIDLPAAEPQRVAAELGGVLGFKPEQIHQVSAKTGAGVKELLEVLVNKIPPPKGEADQPLRALVFDSIYDEYRGVILDVRIVDGSLKSNQAIKLLGSGSSGQALEVGHFAPKLVADGLLACGQIGYIVTNLRSVEQAQVGDTVTLASEAAGNPLPGYEAVTPFVFAGIFPVSGEDFVDLKKALEKLKLNDAALAYEPENSSVLGHGFRIGFLGLLHLEIVKARLEREYGLDLIITNPSTQYQLHLTDGSEQVIQSAADLPDRSKIAAIAEPYIKGEITVPKTYVGSVLQLISQSRGLVSNTNYVDEALSIVEFEAPLAKVLTDFFDNLKSLTSGYGSLSYELAGFREEDLVRLDILVAGEMVESLSVVIHKDEAAGLGRQLVARLKEVIPRQLFEVSLQAAIGNKIIAREDIKALGKNVTGHLYGGDITRKRKLWEKQKAGKKRLKTIGKVEIPAEAFMTLLKK